MGALTTHLAPFYLPRRENKMPDEETQSKMPTEQQTNEVSNYTQDADQLSEMKDVLEIDGPVKTEAAMPEDKTQLEGETETKKPQASDKADEIITPEKPAQDLEQKRQPEVAKDEQGIEAITQKTRTTETDSENQEQKFDVITRDGVKQIPVSNLVTTYQQFADLQRRHTTIKPIFDLMEASGVPANALMAYLELGIKTAKEQLDSKQISKDRQDQAPVNHQQDTGYQGPFKDKDEDDYIKQIDESYHETAWKIWNKGGGTVADNGLEQRIAKLESTIISRTEQQNTQQQQDLFNKGQKAIDERLSKWSGDKNDYFDDPTLGKQREEGFKSFLLTRYPETKIVDLTPEFLSAVFAAFDPVYYNEFLMKLSKQKVEEGQLFTESSIGVRGSGSPKLTEQQEHMADLLDI